MNCTISRFAPLHLAFESRVENDMRSASADQVHHTDLGNARRLATRHGRDLRYCHERRKWYVWNGVRWEADTTGEVAGRAKETVLAIYEEVLAETDEHRRRELAKHAARSEAEPRIRYMIASAQSEKGIAVRAQDFDRDPWSFNVVNGTIDLKTGTLREHRREDLITKLAPIEYDPASLCPTWAAFLHKIMAGNEKLKAFLKRNAGYSLTGDVREQKLSFGHGLGANGKTVFTNALLDVLGDYGMTGAPELLVMKKDAHPTERAELQGARFVVCAEVENERRLAEVLVKQLTGGDRIKGRKMFKDFGEFEPTHKIFLAANHKPVVRGTDHAIWRRIMLIPFSVTIPEEEQDKSLQDKLRTELPGILAWAVQGCLDWQESGLQPPKEVSEATEEYRQEEDMLGDFLKARCALEKDLKASAKSLYEAYRAWCKVNDESPVGVRDFGAALAERGLKKTRKADGIWWAGVGLFPAPPPAPPSPPAV